MFKELPKIEQAQWEKAANAFITIKNGNTLDALAILKEAKDKNFEAIGKWNNVATVNHAFSCLSLSGLWDVISNTTKSLCDANNITKVIPFKLTEHTPSDSLAGDIIVANNRISLRFNGHSDAYSEDSSGTPIIIELRKGEIYVSTYSDIRSPNPTHHLYLAKARNEYRLTQTDEKNKAHA